MPRQRRGVVDLATGARAKGRGFLAGLVLGLMLAACVALVLVWMGHISPVAGTITASPTSEAKNVDVAVVIRVGNAAAVVAA